jgi:hypothetical protein
VRRGLFPLIILTALLATSCGSETREEPVAVSELPVPSTTIAVVDAEDTPDAGDVDETEPAATEPDQEGGEKPTSDDEPAAKEPVVGSNKRLVLAAVEKSASGTDSLRMTMTMVMGGVPELGGDEFSLAMEAAVADGGRRSQFSMDMSAIIDAALADPEIDPLEAELMSAMFGQPLEFRTIDGTVYMSATLLSFFIPAETTWIAFEDERAVSEFGMEEFTAAPGDFLALLRGVDDDAEIVGTEEIDGVVTTHIRGSLSVLDAIAAAPESEQAAVEEALAGLDPSEMVDMSIEIFDIDVWIGEDDLVRRMILSVDDLAAFDQTGDTPEGAYMRLVFEFSDYGGEITIEPPPASDVTVVDEDFFGLGS